MSVKKFCDLCNKEFDEKFDRVYSFSYGEKSLLNISGRMKSGDICENCFKEINEFVKNKVKEKK